LILSFLTVMLRGLVGAVIDEEEEKKRRLFSEDEKYRESLAHGITEAVKPELQKRASHAEEFSKSSVGTGEKLSDVEKKVLEEEKLMEPTPEEKDYQKYEFQQQQLKEQEQYQKQHEEAAVMGTQHAPPPHQASRPAPPSSAFPPSSYLLVRGVPLPLMRPPSDSIPTVGSSPGAVIDEQQELRRRLSHPEEEKKREMLAHQLAGSVKDSLSQQASRVEPYISESIGTGAKSSEVEEKFGAEMQTEQKYLEQTLEAMKSQEEAAQVFQSGPGIKESGVEIKESLNVETTSTGKPIEKVTTVAQPAGGEAPSEQQHDKPKIVIKESGVRLTDM
jgi:hypothetical protein